MANFKMAESLRDGLTARFDKQGQCDVSFMVEGKRIDAHKVVVGVQSEVLDELARDWGQGMDPIPIETMDHKSFQIFLR